MYLVQDAAELRDVGRRIYAAGYTDDLIVQEYLAGDESVMRVVNTYSDRHGRLRFLSAAQIVLGEYDPKLVGNYNAVVTMKDDRLTESIRHLLDSLGYVGAANLDVMYDRRTGTSKILEVNLRQGAASFYTMAAGGNLARCYVEDLVYGRELPEQVTSDARLWVNVPYPVVRALVPVSLRHRVKKARKHGVWHTLRYAPDRSLRRRLDVWRVDLRHARLREVRALAPVGVAPEVLRRPGGPGSSGVADAPGPPGRPTWTAWSWGSGAQGGPDGLDDAARRRDADRGREVHDARDEVLRRRERGVARRVPVHRGSSGPGNSAGRYHFPT